MREPHAAEGGPAARTETRVCIVIAGVGGQGVITAARLLARAAHAEGARVVAGQMHGMSQRGGSVVATVVVGGASSIVPAGTADVLLATEPSEALRALGQLRRGGLAIVSTRPSVPPSLRAGRTAYPDGGAILGALAAQAGAVVAFDGAALALEAGSPQVLNVVMLGALAGSGRAPVGAAALLTAIEATGRGAVVAVNRRAFELGRAQAVRGG
ncbi:MAG: 2-oxoacid:acceptor oxidoreductase family protein [Polyangiaceae bacterium]|nr:2-oxoacid:acceptor oxidoreductase family protein [Polyangiaceae bacterium]